ncbi:branched-chain amino acid aminotransferase [Acholeplasma laidlawii]|uniref:branched-chain-amino-acid transaminase n=3 Tax=Acholeplasma laidlawii TaxID=2148 RepID=A9NHC0_ACHLI|nr:branched-chain amino acid aminotransferase [Acholeplasma laidlawii]ABX81750.1 branched-chain amino acid aminotransferase [Acholeplasma laidlawii PG-8A]NWH10737.1 branched-chain amino acid aminotransferase [Acholeplasma laidlawii]NWH12122.1 branched-chain amino acid aminotransferase [Acholeplasma laidlawii]NWH13508.1 branched-chain amino acid aminotransferase [Acholeplasma laidlawii]NWH14325.1 branched-chain amino acid aminotransferase [Acholeplasma laidlawii]
MGTRMKVEGFKYHGTNKVYYAYYKDGKWDEGKLDSSLHFEISAMAVALHYGQSVFEGLKAYRAKDGRTLLFRPDANAKRLQNSCERLLMPKVPVEMFLDAVHKVVEANKDLVPSYESKGTLYIRPFVIGTETVMGVRSSNEFLFCIVATPVGNYFKDGFKPIDLTTTPYDRAAPNGLGHVKSGANYAASLYPKHLAKQQGFDDCLYLDPKTHTKVDETGATNIIAIKDNMFITPQSKSILPSITNNSLQTIAEKMLGMEVIRRAIDVTELSTFDEVGACGTAAVITPISKIHDNGVNYEFKSYEKLHKLYDLIQSIQFGDIKEDFGWVIEV